MKLDGIRQKVFLDRYALKDTEGKRVEDTPEQMWKRVARGISQQEKPKQRKHWEEKFYNVLEDFKFVPGGRILSGAGTDYEVTYFNCFVIPSPKDSREGILDSLKQLVEIQSRSGGVGLNLSSLRPRGARVKKVNGTSSGPVTWAGLFSYATHDVVQQGGTRRGATMLMLWDWHPDIEEFITVKEDLSKINGANLSVCVSDKFMKAVKEDKDWDLIYPDLDDPRYDAKWDGEIDNWKKIGGKVNIHKTVKARYLWDLICKAAWKSAEPGLHFLERSNKQSNTWYFEKLSATNPCGEQPLGPWAVCNLGAMNLSAYVKNEEFDFDNFGKDAKIAMRLLDNVIDDTYYFYKENEVCAKDIRRTGLGIMGLGDALIKMKLKYGREDALPVIEKIFKVLRDNAYEASSDIAREKGSFPKFKKAKFLKGYHVKALPKQIRDKIAKQGIRNAVLLTVAPTGTTSLVAGVSSGIEPVYEFSFKRRWRGGEDIIYHPLYAEWKEKNPEEAQPEYFVSANSLTPIEHTKVQAIAQRYIDSSISKTVNAPNEHTVDDVKTLYMMAYEMGLKGITYMRDGSRKGVLERIDEKEEKKEKEEVKKHPISKRPFVMHGVTYEKKTPLGNAFVTINSDDNGDPFELFMTVGKSGSDVSAMAEALGRVISVTLRLQGPVDNRERMRQITAQLSGIGGVRSVGFGENRVRSLPDAVAKVLAEHFKFRVNGRVQDKKGQNQKSSHLNEQKTNDEVKITNGNGHTNGIANGSIKAVNKDIPELKTDLIEEKAEEELAVATIEPSTNSHTDLCPMCGSATFVHEEGCAKCYSCGHSEC